MRGGTLGFAMVSPGSSDKGDDGGTFWGELDGIL